MIATSKQRILQQLGGIQRLRATGPLSPSYTWWVDQTRYTLQQLFGEGSWQVRRFQEAVGQRGTDDTAGLPLWGQWGMLARLDRAEGVLQSILRSLEEGL